MELKGLFDAAYYVEDNKPNILFMYRDKGKKNILKVDNFRPYIYTTVKEYNRKKEFLSKYIYGVEYESRKLITGEEEELIKLILHTPFDVYNVKQILSKTFEADILFVNKFIIDNVTKLESSNYRKHYFDIETTSIKGFPDYMNPIENIISIAVYDNYINEYFLWIWHKDYKCETFETINQKGKLNIRRFNSEYEMLDNYLDFVNQTQPDYMIAWNIAFDINYLTARCEYLNLDIRKLSPLHNTLYEKKMKIVKWLDEGLMGKRVVRARNLKNIKVVGLQAFDLLNAYRLIVAQEQESWKLDYIAEKELGEKKLAVDFNIGETWMINPGYIEEYNYIDTYLIKQLDEKLQLVDYYNEVKDSVFLYNINDTFSSGRVLDNYILKKYGKEYIFPSKVYQPELRKGVGGALVRQPNPGLYKNVAVFDFSGFYPNLIKTFNLSGDVIRKEEIEYLNKDAEEIQDVTDLLSEKLYDFNKTTGDVTYYISTNKFKAKLTYNLSRKGVMGQSVNDLMKLRNVAKKTRDKLTYGTVEYEQWDKIQQSYKFIINAAYGTSAYPGFRLFNNSNANAITAFARMASKWISYNLDKRGWKTLGGDTDSLFIQLKTTNIEENLRETEDIQKVIKQNLDIFVRKFLPESWAKHHTLVMEMEKIYKSLLLPDVKKRYIGILEYYKGKVTDKVHYMGLDLKKSNTIQLCKDAQKNLALALLRNQDWKEILIKYYDIVDKSRDINLFKMASKLNKPIKEYLSKTPATRAVLWSNKNLNTKYNAGDKFFIIYVKDINTDVIAFEDGTQLEPLKFSINKIKYFRDLHSKIDNLIRSIPEIKEYNDKLYFTYTDTLKAAEILQKKQLKMYQKGQTTLF